jgi:hypothetical protein
MQEPVSVGDLFQQINSLRNEMEIAKQSNQEGAEELENDKVEIGKLTEKEAYLRAKNEAKLKKGMEVDVQLQAKRELVSFTRQVCFHYIFFSLLYLQVLNNQKPRSIPQYKMHNKKILRECSQNRRGFGGEYLEKSPPLPNGYILASGCVKCD